MPLNADDFKRLVEILAGWPGWRLERDRLDFMEEALRPSPRAHNLLGQFIPGGNSHNTAVRAVSWLDQFQEDIPDREVTCLLIAALRSKVGRREQADLDAIAGRLNCPVPISGSSLEQENNEEPKAGGTTPPDIEHMPPDPEPDKPDSENQQNSGRQQKPRNWTIPVVLGLLIGSVSCAATVLALVPEAQRGDLFKTLFPIAASSTATARSRPLMESQPSRSLQARFHPVRKGRGRTASKPATIIRIVLRMTSASGCGRRGALKVNPMRHGAGCLAARTMARLT